MSESEAIELMRELASNVPGSDTPTSETQSWTDVFPELAVDRAASQGKYVPLPAPLTLFGFHVQAMAAANVGNVFAPLTSFVQTDEGFWGFQMAWLEQEPENRYTEIYTLNMIVDIPHMEHVDDAELLPATSGPIYDSALRVAAAIRNPESCTQRSYYEDEFFLDYIFLYPHEGKTRLYELLSIRNVLIGD